MEEFLLNPIVIAVILLWVLPWKGWALWKAAKLNHTGWFIALLVVNTLAILEIIYIFIVAKRSEDGDGGVEISDRSEK